MVTVTVTVTATITVTMTVTVTVTMTVTAADGIRPALGIERRMFMRDAKSMRAQHVVNHMVGKIA